MTPEEFINKWIGFIMPDDLKAVRADLNSIFNHSVDTNEMLADQPDPKPEWISVEDKLPEKFIHVLVSYRKIVEVGYVGSMGWETQSGYMGITHWMPLNQAHQRNKLTFNT